MDPKARAQRVALYLKQRDEDDEEVEAPPRRRRPQAPPASARSEQELYGAGPRLNREQRRRATRTERVIADFDARHPNPNDGALRSRHARFARSRVRKPNDVFKWPGRRGRKNPLTHDQMDAAEARAADRAYNREEDASRR